MDDVSALAFIDKKDVEVHFFNRKTIIFDYDIEETIEKNIRETGNYFYYRITREEKTGWFDKDFTKVPTSIEHKLEQIMKKALKD